jgi:hypothetical protein
VTSPMTARADRRDYWSIGRRLSVSSSTVALRDPVVHVMFVCLAWSHPSAHSHALLCQRQCHQVA